MQNLGPIIHLILYLGLLDFVVLDIDHRTLQEKKKNYQMIWVKIALNKNLQFYRVWRLPELFRPFSTQFC